LHGRRPERQPAPARRSAETDGHRGRGRRPPAEPARSTAATRLRVPRKRARRVSQAVGAHVRCPRAAARRAAPDHPVTRPESSHRSCRAVRRVARRPVGGAAAVHAVARQLRRARAGASGHGRVRHRRVRRNPPHPGDRHPGDAGRRPGRCAPPHRQPRPRSHADRHRARRRRRARDHAGPEGVPLRHRPTRPGRTHGGGAVGRGHRAGGELSPGAPAAEDRLGGPHLAVMGYGLWRRQFAGARDVLGRTLHVAGDVYTIVGVAPEAFTGVALTDVDLFLPITTTKFDAGPAALASRDYSWVRVVARLAPGVTIPQAQAEAKVVYQRGNPSAAASPVPSWQIAMLGGQPADVHPVMELRRELASGNIPITLWLLGVATAVLLIACANVGGLLLARGVRNRREIAVRASLGASRAQLFGELLLESGILALAGGGLGFLAARWADGLIRRFSLTDFAAVA